MPVIRKFCRSLKRIYYGFETPKELFLKCVDKIASKVSGKHTGLYFAEHQRRLQRDFRKGDTYLLKDARLPIIKSGEEGTMRLLNLIDMDIFSSYLYCNDQYNEKIFDELEPLLPEGLYGLVNDKVNVVIESGDIVIDAGSCCGSFSAYASVKGAEAVYAFEPVADNFAYLERTSSLNVNIHPVNKGLSDENTSRDIFINPEHFSGSSFIVKTGSGVKSAEVETVRLDDFVRENNIPRIDFIKADIEGFERHMLEGAQETLARFSPKLALCTYHLPDDPQVMAELILKANPNYNIVQRRKKLFASVPK